MLYSIILNHSCECNCIAYSNFIVICEIYELLTYTNQKIKLGLSVDILLWEL